MNVIPRRLRSGIADNRAALVVLILYAILATAYNLADPLFEPPDELLHYEFIRFLQREGRLPAVDVSGPETEYHQPPLYYALTAFITAPVSKGDLAPHTLRNPFWAYEIGRVGRDNKNQYLHGPDQRFPFDDATRAVHLTRALSTVFGCGTVALTYLLARQFLSKSLAVASMAIVAFLPNFLLTSGAVTNDSLVILVSAVVGLDLVQLVARETPPPLPVWVRLGALLGLGILTKLSAWPLLPLAGLAVTLLALRLRSWRVFVTAGLLLIACVVLIGGWWVVRNLSLYGDPTGLDSMRAVWGIRKPPTWRTYLTEFHYFRTTFWANFGYGNVPLPVWVYTIADIFVAGGAAGLLSVLVRRRRDAFLQVARRDQIIILVVWVMLTLGALIWHLQRAIAVTARHLYPVLPVLALGLGAGWSGLVPGRWRRRLAVLIACLMLVFAIGAWLGALVPAYRSAPRLSADQAELTIDHHLDWQFGDVVTLLGYDVSPNGVRPGQDVMVTFYWQSLRTPDRNYAVFVHFFGEDNELVGARDTYPGLGHDPTTLWAPGEIIMDAIPAPIAADAQGPVLLDIEAGLYDLDTDERLVVRDATGNTVGYPVVGKVKLLGGPEAVRTPSHLVGATFEGGLVLEGHDLSATTLSPGSVLTLTLYWAPAGPLKADYTTFVHLVDEEDRIVAQGDSRPRGGRYPTTAWAAGEHFDDTYTLSLPLDMAPGDYYLLAGLYKLENNARLSLTDGSDCVRLQPALVVHEQSP